MCADILNRWCCGVITVLFLVSHSAVADTSNNLTLSANAPLEIALAEGDQRNVILALEPGNWLLEADEDFVDVVIAISDDSGNPVSTLYGIDQGFAEIRHLLHAPIATQLRLAIDAKSVDARDATLRLKLSDASTLLTDIHTATALRLEDALSQVPAKASDDERIAAREIALTTANQWQLANNTRRAGINQYYAATLSYALEQMQLSRDYALSAAQTLAPTGDAKWQGFSVMLAGLDESQLRNYDRAQSLLQRAEVLLAPMYSGRRVNPSKSNQCFIFLKQRQSVDAERCYREILPVAEQAGDTRSVARYYRNIAGAYEIRGDFAGAAEVLESALLDIDATENPRDLTAVLTNLARSLAFLGKTQLTITHYQRALEVSRELGDDRQTARVLTNLAGVYSKLGIPRRAVVLLEEAITLRQDGLPEWLNVTKRDLAHALVAAGDYDAARHLLESVRNDPQLNPRGSFADRIEISLATIDIRTNNYDAAIRRLTPVAARFSEEDGERANYAAAQLQLGRALLGAQRWQEALAAVKAAHEIYLQRKDRMRQSEALALMATILWSRDDKRQAQSHAQEAIELIESLRADIANADLRASYQAAVADASELLLHSYIVLDDDPERALAAAEKARARTLVDALSKSNDAPDARAPSALTLERDQLRAEINRAEAERIRGARSADISELAIRLDVLDGKIASLDPRYGAATSAVSLEPNEMQRMLNDDEVAIQYSLGKRHSYRWIITSDRIVASELPDVASINALARELNLALAKRSNVTQSATKLGSIVLRDIESIVPEARNVIIIADRGLHYVPFDVLRTDAAAAPPLQGKSVTYAPSLTTLSLNRNSPRKPDSIVTVLADPVFNETDQRAQRVDVVKATRSSDSVRGLNRLAMTALEAETIGNLATDYKVNVFTGFAANADTLKTEAVTNATVLHIATHGFVDDEIPESNGLALSIRNSAGEPQPGYVGLRDIYELRLNARLVVLSACDTALGREMIGEGLLGITRGFMYAGAERVLASLWQVEDRATAELMKHFYTALLNDGLAPPAALATAKAKLRANRRWRHPYYWSGFVLLGDWAPMQ